MIPILALTMDGPLMLMFGIVAAAVLGAAGGYVLGTRIGATSPGTPLPTTLRLTRESLASVTAQLEKASSKLNGAQHPELSGTALVLGRRVTDMASELGRIEQKAKHTREGSA